MQQDALEFPPVSPQRRVDHDAPLANVAAGMHLGPARVVRNQLAAAHAQRRTETHLDGRAG